MVFSISSCEDKHTRRPLKQHGKAPITYAQLFTLHSDACGICPKRYIIRATLSISCNGKSNKTHVHFISCTTQIAKAKLFFGTAHNLKKKTKKNMGPLPFSHALILSFSNSFLTPPTPTPTFRPRRRGTQPRASPARGIPSTPLAPPLS